MKLNNVKTNLGIPKGNKMKEVIERHEQWRKLASIHKNSANQLAGIKAILVNQSTDSIPETAEQSIEMDRNDAIY